MTLINYLTRVHFADRVLEEALRSELEALDMRRLLILADRAAAAGAGFERLMAGIPCTVDTDICHDTSDPPSPEAVRRIVDIARQAGAGALVAYGSWSTINLAKLARLALATGRAGDHPSDGGRETVLAVAPPQLIAVPGLDGVAAAVSPQTMTETAEGGFRVLHRRDLLPAVAICDPTLTAGSPAPASASAGVEAIGGCIEAYLSNVYNPPADGIALDGLRRAAQHLRPAMERDTPEARREMMASALNGALALQKGHGAAQTLTLALSSVASRRNGAVPGTAFDRGAVVRLVLPGLLRFHAHAAREKYQPLRSILEVPARDTLSRGVEALFHGLPLPSRLSQMGLERRDLERGARLAAGNLAFSATPRQASSQDLQSILDHVF